ncbi:hypothetical protein EN933_01905 [Mesorhizobium sp. M7A.F.Ca.US.001.01.1.1]|nr:hypothetical protein EN933_01905 [Mesorhizobium sp. M7A.F.Ca.US.001.01.1.1]
MDKKQVDDLIAEMRSIKKLLILQLMRNDAPQKQIASMLEISEATMSRMIPKGVNVKKAKIPAISKGPGEAEF